MKRRKTLRQMLFPLIILIAFVPMSLYAAISVGRLWQSMSDDLIMHINSSMDKAERSLDMVLDKYGTILKDLCTDDEIVQIVKDIDDSNHSENNLDVSTAVLRRELSHICNRNEAINGITIFTNDGSVIFYDKLAASSDNSDWADEIPKPEVKEGALYEGVTEPVHTGTRDYYMFRISRRILDYEDIHKDLGVVVLSLDETAISSAMSSGHDTEFYLLNERNQVISALDQSEIGKKEEDIKTGENRYTSIVNDVTGLIIYNLQSMESYYQTLGEQLIFMASITLLAIAVLTLLMYSLNRPVIRKVNQMTEAMGRVEQGDFTVQIPITGKDPVELEEIIQGFNHMVSHTDSLIHQVRDAVVEQKNAELYALEAQIDPHFLYNTLDTINWTAIENEQYEISEMVGALADILRYTIRNTNEETSIEQELYWLDQYILLQSKRLERPLKTTVDVPESLKPYKIHKLLLQPFIENSIKYGVHNINRNGELNISMKQVGDQIHICIDDNGNGIDKEQLTALNDEHSDMGEHYGVTNVRKRLKLYYGDEANLYFESKIGKYTRVHMFIPLEKRGDQQ